MIERIRRSFQIWRESLAILKADKELLLFPIISFGALLLVVLTFSILSPLMFGLIPGVHIVNLPDYGEWVLLLLFYLACYFVVLLFNTGLIGCALMRLEGKDPTVGDGLRIAWANAGRVLRWAAIAATVGLVFRLLETLDIEIKGVKIPVGAIVSRMLGFTWSLVTFLIVPVLIVEKIGVFDSLRRSGTLLEQTWGEQVVGEMAVGLTAFLLAVPGAALLAGGYWVGNPLLLLGAVVVVGIYWLGLAVVQFALSGIYVAALYRYAVTGHVPEGFSPRNVKHAFLRAR